MFRIHFIYSRDSILKIWSNQLQNQVVGKMTNSKRIKVSEEDRSKLLLWCARHCCFCGKSCTTNIEVHHIDGNPSNNELDNLIPLCFDCHGELNRYNPQHPKGIKYRQLEITTRRDQIFEQYTLPYLRHVNIKISKYNLLLAEKKIKQEREFGDISCTAKIHSIDLPVRLRIQIKPYHKDKHILVDLGDLYSGKALWNLNPGFSVHGHFEIPITPEFEPFHFRLEIFYSVIDKLEWEHKMLPFSVVWDNSEGDWWFDPRVKFDK